MAFTHFLLRLGNHASGALSRGVWGPRRAVKTLERRGRTKTAWVGTFHDVPCGDRVAIANKGREWGCRGVEVLPLGSRKESKSLEIQKI